MSKLIGALSKFAAQLFFNDKQPLSTEQAKQNRWSLKQCTVLEPPKEKDPPQQCPRSPGALREFGVPTTGPSRS